MVEFFNFLLLRLFIVLKFHYKLSLILIIHCPAVTSFWRSFCCVCKSKIIFAKNNLLKIFYFRFLGIFSMFAKSWFVCTFLSRRIIKDNTTKKIQFMFKRNWIWIFHKFKFGRSWGPAKLFSIQGQPKKGKYEAFSKASLGKVCYFCWQNDKKV